MEQLQAQVVPFLLVLMRLSGVFMIAPVLASTGIPARARALLVFVITLCVYPLLVKAGSAAPAATDVVGIAVAAVMEVFLGFVMGLLMLLPVVAVQLAGTIMGQQIGFGLATVINPALESESDLLGEVLMGIALAAFITMGGVEALFIAVTNTFAKVPLGCVGIADAPGQLVTGALSGGLELALRISAPVLGILFIETIASAFVMKTMPQVNIFSIGFAIKIILGLSVLALSLHAIDAAINDTLTGASRRLLTWSLPGAPAPIPAP